MKASAESESENALSPVEKRIARTLVQLRRDNDLTLSELSERTGLSESYLSRVENLKAAISIAKLAKLAEAYVVPVSSFFEGDGQEPRYQFTPAGSGTKVRLRGRDGIDIRLLATNVKARMMEPFIVDAATAQRTAPMQSHEGDEFIYVIKGRCRLHFGTEGFGLSEGDSIYFDSGVSHRIEATGNRPCEVLSVVTSRDFTFHGNMARLLNE